MSWFCSNGCSRTFPRRADEPTLCDVCRVEAELEVCRARMDKAAALMRSGCFQEALSALRRWDNNEAITTHEERWGCTAAEAAGGVRTDAKVVDCALADAHKALREAEDERDEARAQWDELFEAYHRACNEVERARDEAHANGRERDEALYELRSLRGEQAGVWVSPAHLAEAQKERDEARAEVARLRADLQSSAYMRVKRQRDEARAEVERMRAGVHVADGFLVVPNRMIFEFRYVDRVISAGKYPIVPGSHYGESVRFDLRVARESWDANGAIDDADELAAYAEASDLRALAEREAVTEGGGDE